MCQYDKSQYDASQMFPIKTGISLTEDEWAELTAHSDDICEELKAKTAGTEYHIGNEKYVSLSQYGDKGPITISIRQHYTFDDGVHEPTKNGINLKKKEWQVLVSVMDVIDESIENLKSDFTYDGKTIMKSVCVYFVEKKCYQYCIGETGEVFYSPIEEPDEAYKSYLKHRVWLWENIMHFTYVDFVADYPTLINLDTVFVDIKPLQHYEKVEHWLW